jgi:enamine deaminase RidA (YjgF/YER057c/UK114 family)
MEQMNIPGSSPYELLVGFSRAVRIGNSVFISGTAPIGAEEASLEDQTRAVFGFLEAALLKAGARLGDVYRTRIYITRADDWETVGRVHGELFHTTRPATTMVVAQLLDPRRRVEGSRQETDDKAR